MSSLECLYGEYIKNCKIENVIIDRKKGKKISHLRILHERGYFINQEKGLLNLLYKSYGLSWLRYKVSDVTEILLLKKHCNSTFIFTFNKKEDSLFFH